MCFFLIAQKLGGFPCSLAKKVYVEYHLLIVRRHAEFAINEVVLKNLNSLCNVEFILGLPCILCIC